MSKIWGWVVAVVGLVLASLGAGAWWQEKQRRVQAARQAKKLRKAQAKAAKADAAKQLQDSKDKLLEEVEHDAAAGDLGDYLDRVTGHTGEPDA